LKQIAPGRYEALFTPTDQGVYLIHFSGTSQAGETNHSFAETTGWALSYSPEFKRIDSDPDLLLRLATVSGGKVASSDPAEAFAHDLQATRAARPIWPGLLLLAALLLPLDIASRRLIITRQDMLRLREWAIGKLATEKPDSPQPVQSAPHVQALFKAKSRVSENIPSGSVALGGETSQSIERKQIDHESSREEKVTPEAVPGQPEPGRSTASSLLARKKATKRKRN
jgi:hypothetical protein